MASAGLAMQCIVTGGINWLIPCVQTIDESRYVFWRECVVEAGSDGWLLYSLEVSMNLALLNSVYLYCTHTYTHTN